MITIPGKIPVTIRPFFWVLCLLLGWLATESLQGVAMWTFVIFVSVLVHEYGHALTALAFGQKAKIDLTGFGGLTRRTGKRLRPWQDFLIVLNGPLAGFLLFGLSFFLRAKLAAAGNQVGPFYEMLDISTRINLFWTVLNLVPIQPLDGGQLLSLFLSMLFGFRGVKISLFLSIVFSVLLAIYGFSINDMILGILFTFFAFESYRAWKESRMVSEADHNQEWITLFNSAEEDIRQHNRESAIAKYSHILENVKSGLLHIVVTTRMALLFVDEGKVRGAYDLLLPIKKHLDPEGVDLLHQVAYRLGEWQVVSDVGKRLFELRPNYDVAWLNALACAKLGNANAAVGWLRGAIREGLPSPEQAILDPAFDAIRADPAFRQITF
jgi:stage IV sporulation protein FB